MSILQGVSLFEPFLNRPRLFLLSLFCDHPQKAYQDRPCFCDLGNHIYQLTQTLGFLQNIFLCWWTNSGYQRLKHLNCLKPFHQKMRDSRVSTGYTASFWTMNSCLSPNFGRMLQSFCAIHLEVAFTKTPIRNCRRIPVITGRQRTWHLQHLKNEQGKKQWTKSSKLLPLKNRQLSDIL